MRGNIMNIILLSLCVISIERTSANNVNDKNSQKGLDTCTINFVVYAGKVQSALNKDPKYDGMKEKLRDPTATDGVLLQLLAVMSNSTRTKLNKIKSEEAQRYLEECSNQKGGTEPPKPDYIDINDPEKFNAIDLNLLISKVFSFC
ncbi:unnamed protein product [Bemisia tabaci]|uniref:NUCB1-like N-terminal domain-containing protein n=1 Tax=Bemisia tabaci TaxID=7038 RepID=A0A9P0A8G9_BEMTA|nr:unnamed protein product [Bemisia tabaci]